MKMPPQFDPSKMDPKLLMELSQLVYQLPPDKLNRMQSLMHNMMAGHDVRKEMEEFEKTLPPGFREKLMKIMMTQGAGAGMAAEAEASYFQASSSSQGTVIEAETVSEPDNMDIREARLTILNAVAQGNMSPEEAERLLFTENLAS